MSGFLRRRLGPVIGLAAAVLCVTSEPAPLGAAAPFAAEAALARASAAAVRGVALSVEARRDPAVDAIYTHVSLAVSQAWGMSPAPSTVEVKLLGGVLPGRALLIGGQASFTPGEEVMVFLDVRPRDQSLSVTGLERGKWSLPHGADATATARQTRHETAIRTDAMPLPALEALAALAGTTVRLSPGARQLMAADSPHDAPVARDDVMPAVSGRWHEADWGAPVFVDSMSGGHALFPAGGFTQLLRAVEAWSAPGALRLQPGVLRGPRCFGNLETPDGRISVSYDDPCGEIANTSPTLAIGGAYYSTADVRLVQGVAYGKLTKGMVVLDDTRAKFAGLSTGCYEEVLTHELGHAVGLAHTTGSPAVMAPWLGPECVHRTESLPLQAADLAALEAVYPVAPPAEGPPGAPAGLTAQVSGDTVQTAWLPTGAAATTYRLLVGSLPGAADLGSFDMSSAVFTATAVPRGVYYVRAVAMNAHGASAPSPDTVVVVGEGLPGAPVGLMAAAGQTGDVRVLWQPPRTGAPPASYLLLVGASADRPTLHVPVNATSLAAHGVAAGTYFVRAIAVNDAGYGPASAEILVVVP